MTGPDNSCAAVAPLLVLAVGNPSRGDDALGPMLLEALRAEGVEGNGQVELLGDFQLQIEHVIDLRGRRGVLFVDAARPGTTDLTLKRLAAASTLPVLSHALEPAAVLHVARRLGETVPPAWQLAIEGEAFELGAGLSAVARARLPLALAQARQWVSEQGAGTPGTTGVTPDA